MLTRILLIRHASTDPNGRLCGSFDVPLSPAGLADVQALIRRPATRPAPDVLFTSALRRAREAAAALARAWTLEPQPAEWAREIHCGEVEGMLLEDVRRRYPDAWFRNAAQSDDRFAWPGGESYRDFWTVSHRPWAIVVSLEFPTEAEAVRFEKYLKSGSGRAFAKRHFAPLDDR